ncbi:hypothetical protein CHARACLAT_031814 [Characodon lateralis]|uniref:Uncharacterized protein n=1 Tax=Characodon lateralis TaxID=208331 RepID=A0ABU7DLL2_9TELE|nr:hypothetical protein [Characodon lateralis]
MAKKERFRHLLENIDLLPQDKQGDTALQLFPVLLPAAPYKVGRRVFRSSNLEVQKAFIDIQPVGTNMVEYLQSATTEYPYVLILGYRQCYSQAFLIIHKWICFGTPISFGCC